jgi:hypothetical protein
MTRSALLLAIIAVLTTPAVAADSPSSAPSQATAKADRPDDKVICKFVNTTGSRLSRNRLCQTRAQWDQMSHDAIDDINTGLGRATGDATNGPH